MTVSVFDAHQCTLGEGPLWHPKREQFFWFDIVEKQLLTSVDGNLSATRFDELVSAAGWIDTDTLFMASQSGLYTYDITTGERVLVTGLEADNPDTRSNDGRADPWGGFWIGTMSMTEQKNAGAIYRWYKGELKCLYPSISISNSICFSPDKSVAYFSDTPTQKIMRQPLAPDDGWPVGAPEVFVDLAEDGLYPDGSVVDADGCLWNAQWGAARVSKYGPDGTFLEKIDLPAAQTTCPAFGGADLGDLYVTSAATGRDGAEDGKTFIVTGAAVGQAEHQVLL